jgi:hypothetical protein
MPKTPKVKAPSITGRAKPLTPKVPKPPAPFSKGKKIKTYM